LKGTRIGFYGCGIGLGGIESVLLFVSGEATKDLRLNSLQLLAELARLSVRRPSFLSILGRNNANSIWSGIDGLVNTAQIIS
jgi:hypothetical protein